MFVVVFSFTFFGHLNQLTHSVSIPLRILLLNTEIVNVFSVISGQDLMNLIPGSYVGRLFPKASNLKDLVVHAYKVNITTAFSFTSVSASAQGRFDGKVRNSPRTFLRLALLYFDSQSAQACVSDEE